MTGMRAREALAPESPQRLLTRADVLALCRRAAADFDPTRQRNLALFFDGTGNILGDSSPTNVVRLWAAAERSARQICYYDPGVGTPNQAPPATLAADWIECGRSIDADAACASTLATRRIESSAVEAECEGLRERVSRLDPATQRDIHAAITAGRHPRGQAGDLEVLARLVRSAARPGLRERIAAYRHAQRH